MEAPQLYASVFTRLKPSATLPEINVEFRRYASARAQIQFHSGVLTVKLADSLAAAPLDVQEALAEILLSKLFRRPVPRESNRRYRSYLNRHDVRQELDQIRRVRGRKLIDGPAGENHDLLAIFDELNFTYFFGLMARPTIGWSRQPSRTLLGHYDPSHNTIVISRALDRADIPRLAVEYVMYHEMLHLRHPAEHRSVRRCVHTRAFKEDEKLFPKLREAKALLKRLV